MSDKQLRELNRLMDKSPAFKHLIEQNVTPYGLNLLRKYAEESRPWYRRVLSWLRRK